MSGGGQSTRMTQKTFVTNASDNDTSKTHVTGVYITITMWSHTL